MLLKYLHLLSQKVSIKDSGTKLCLNDKWEKLECNTTKSCIWKRSTGTLVINYTSHRLLSSDCKDLSPWNFSNNHLCRSKLVFSDMSRFQYHCLFIFMFVPRSWSVGGNEVVCIRASNFMALAWRHGSLLMKKLEDVMLYCKKCTLHRSFLAMWSVWHCHLTALYVAPLLSIIIYSFVPSGKFCLHHYSPRICCKRPSESMKNRVSTSFQFLIRLKSQHWAIWVHIYCIIYNKN